MQLGLLPAAGGTQRLPRLIGLTAALPLLLTARTLRVKQAIRVGLVDELIPPYGTKETAVKKALELVKKANIKRKRKRSVVSFLLNPIRGKGNSVFAGQKNDYAPDLRLLPCSVCHHRSGGTWPGIRKGLGAEKEIELFSRLVTTSQSKSLMSLFFGMSDLKKNPQKSLARKVGKVAVIGTGLMGQGIASVQQQFAIPF